MTARPVGQPARAVRHCCARMAREVTKPGCDAHPDRRDCPEVLLAFSPALGAYGLVIHGSSAGMPIDFCPFCGSDLRARRVAP